MKKGRQARHRIPRNSCLVFSLLSMDLNFQTLFIVTETGIKCRVAAVKESLVLHHSTGYNYIFWPCRINGFI